MSKSQVVSGYVDIDQTRLYYETAGSGIPLILVHAGVADCEQWDNEFLGFSDNFHVVRYDMRGYGNSDPVESSFSHLSDLVGVIDELNLSTPLIMMGCSIGGVLSLNYALENPQNMRALIMIGPGSCGFELENCTQELFLEAMIAFEEGDLNRLAEIETQIWFDCMHAEPDQVDQSMRALLYDMNRSVLSRESQNKGQDPTELPKPSITTLKEIDIPVLIVVGSEDLPYMHAAADYLVENIQFARKEIIEDAAHLPNMDQPHLFQEVVLSFLDEVTGGRDYDQMLP
jgi:pimeloyl-ACP methyl ester carboxylesterase